MGRVQRFKTYEEAERALREDEFRASQSPEGRAALLRDAATLQKTAGRLRGCGLVPRGLYRFKTVEEADEWMDRMTVVTHVSRNSRTS